MNNKPKIFLFCLPAVGWGKGDVCGYSLAEDGETLNAHHVSTSVEWSKHDMGFTSDWKDNIYKKKYPNGYELVWIGATQKELDAHAEFQMAYIKIKTQKTSKVEA